MNDKEKYEEMINMPLNECNITYKKGKKKKVQKVKLDDVKKQIIDKVNKENEKPLQPEQSSQPAFQNSEVNDLTEKVEESSVIVSEVDSDNTASVKVKEKKKFKFGFVAFQVVVVCLLFATIIVTNTLIPTSGINNFFKGVFGGETERVDNRVYSDFKLNLPVFDQSKLTVENGVMNISGEGSIYSPANGKVTSIDKLENGKFSVEVCYSENFKGVISGLDYVFCETGDTVLTKVPIGYSLENSTVCFLDQSDLLIGGYSVENGCVIWAV